MGGTSKHTSKALAGSFDSTSNLYSTATRRKSRHSFFFASRLASRASFDSLRTHGHHSTSLEFPLLDDNIISLSSSVIQLPQMPFPLSSSPLSSTSLSNGAVDAHTNGRTFDIAVNNMKSLRTDTSLLVKPIRQAGTIEFSKLCPNIGLDVL